MGGPEFWNDLISDYEKATGTKYVKVYKTPGTPGQILVKNKEGPVKEAEYRKTVEKLFWTVKKESPDCANALQELSAHLSNPGKEHWDAVGRVIGFLAGNTERVLKSEFLQAYALSDMLTVIGWLTRKQEKVQLVF